MIVRKLNDFLHASPTLDNLAHQAERLMALQKTLNIIVPQPLAKFCSVASFSNESLVIYTDNGAIAAKLKQQLPTLLAKFRERGVEVTAIRVEVQARSPHTNQHKIKEIAPSTVGLQSLKALAESLGDSPLKSAITTMLSRHSSKN